jgi:hypothetical protein
MLLMFVTEENGAITAFQQEILPFSALASASFLR